MQSVSKSGLQLFDFRMKFIHTTHIQTPHVAMKTHFKIWTPFYCSLLYCALSSTFTRSLHGHCLSCWPSCTALMPIRMLWTNLVEPPAVQQGGQLVQTGLRGVEQLLDTQKVSLWRGHRNREKYFTPRIIQPFVLLGGQLGVCARYLSCGEERHSKLEQTLDLDLHGGQRPLENGQRLQTGKWSAALILKDSGYSVVNKGP